jgi:hypothetical protein
MSQSKENYVPFVSEVEEFNALMNKPNNYEPTIPENRLNGSSFITSFSRSLKNINKLAKQETSLKFWMLCVTLLMYPLGTVLCFMVLRIKFGPLIWKYRHQTFQKLALHKKKQKRLLKFVPKNKVNLVIEKVGDKYVVYRSSDRKVMKNINYFKPNLKQFFE